MQGRSFSALVESCNTSRLRTPRGLRLMCTVTVFCAAVGIAASAQGSNPFTTLASFSWANGSDSYAALVQGRDGNFYGTQTGGGEGSNCSFNSGCGTVYKVTPSGVITTLYSFCSQPNCTDGLDPWGGLVQGSDGNFYGITYYGGTNLACYEGGCGTVFRVTPAGTLTTLYNFCNQPNCADGAIPYAGLVLATDGNFYGTTSGGGANGSNGTIFKITPSGTLTTLYSFCSQSGCADGSDPFDALVQARDGSLYGTTFYGGNSNCNGGLGCGTVFKITLTGTLTSLHSFDETEGQGLAAGVMQARDGNFYGTAAYGGAGHSGTVFKITPAGVLTVLHSFHNTDGYGVWAGLVQGRDGNLYGATYEGGPGWACGDGCGTVFSITPQGTLTTLHVFCGQFNCPDGANPEAALVQATDGNLYGTTSGRGAYEYGTVFRLTPARRCATCGP